MAGMVRVYGAGAGAKTSVLLARDFAARAACVAWYVDSKGGSLHMTEGYRPTGVPSDRYVTDPSRTSTGTSTQWYQVGRMDRGLTPSAIIPNASGSNLSKHSTGNALDCNAPTSRDMTLRAEGAYLAGCGFPVASESWHMEAVTAPRVDLADFYRLVDGHPVAITKEGFLMSLNTTQQKAVHASLVNTQGGYYYKTDAIINDLKRIEGKINDIVAGRIRYPGAGYYMATAIVNAVREDQGKESVEVDEAALGKAIADNLAPVLQAAIEQGDVSGATAAEIADELAKRLAA